MRLDLLLKQSGIIKRRTVAKALAENGKISINGKVAKPSSDVKEDDVLLLNLGMYVIEVEIHFEVKGKREVPTFVQLSKKKVTETDA